MRSLTKSGRLFRRHFALAVAVSGLVTAGRALGDGVLFDNISPLENGTTLPSDAKLYYTTPNPTPTNRPPDSAIADTFEGEAYVLPTGTTTITGVDLLFCNSTNNPSLSPYSQYNGGSGTDFSAFRVNVFLWGTVTPTPLLNSSNPALSSTNKAFGTLLQQETFTFAGSSADDLPVSNDIYSFDNGGISPALPFPTPVSVNGSTTIGVTFNIQGSTDGGVTYSNYAGLTPIIDGDIQPTVGSQQLNAFYINDSGETDGNYTQGPHYFQEMNASGATVPIPYQGIGTRIFGVAPGITYNWVSAVNGSFSDANKWNPAAVPGGNDTAVFNLAVDGRTAPAYTVTVNATYTVANLFVQSDNVTIDLPTNISELVVNNALTVGQPSVSGTTTYGFLNLTNSSGSIISHVEAGSIAIGGNGGTGTLTVGEAVFLISDGDTSVSAGSSLIIQNFAKLSTSTLTIAGTTNAWTGTVDLGASSLDLVNGNIATVINQLKSGFNNGTWTGKGIISSFAQTDSTHLTALGAILNNDGHGNRIYGSGTTLGLFDAGNATIDSTFVSDPALTDVLIKYTYFGDANLDGVVDGSDYTLIDNGFNNHLTGWYNGDFNYDGKVDGSDYTLIDNAFNTQGASLGLSNFTSHGGPSASSLLDGRAATDATTDGNLTASTTSQIAPVPEPTSIGILALGAIPMLRRRARAAR